MLVFVAAVALSLSGSVEKAALLEENGLLDDAKRELIDVIFSNEQAPAKAEAYFRLGSVSLGQGNSRAARAAWRALIEKYPKSEQARMVGERMKQLSEALQQTVAERVDNVTAQSYLEHGDFWSRDKNQMFTIDSSWLPNVEMALAWYDRVITEFPQSASSRIAYEQKLKTLLGWKERGSDGDSYGVQADFSKYMPQVLSTFAAFEKENPSASSLQAFRFQIAQAYWSESLAHPGSSGDAYIHYAGSSAPGAGQEATKWLKSVIEHAPDGSSFYKDLAERRLAAMKKK
jgi:tetratricopeptide (TPR) repeat protein